MPFCTFIVVIELSLPIEPYPIFSNVAGIVRDFRLIVVESASLIIPVQPSSTVYSSPGLLDGYDTNFWTVSPLKVYNTPSTALKFLLPSATSIDSNFGQSSYGFPNAIVADAGITIFLI